MEYVENYTKTDTSLFRSITVITISLRIEKDHIAPRGETLIGSQIHTLIDAVLKECVALKSQLKMLSFQSSAARTRQSVLHSAETTSEMVRDSNVNIFVTLSKRKEGMKKKRRQCIGA